MTEQVAGRSPRSGWTRSGLRSRSEPGAGRALQLALSCLWLLDALLQMQAFMFGRGFAAMLRQAAPGNPGVIAAPMTWSARLIEQHAVSANAAFAAIQLVIALGIAWRPTLRIALAVSVAWSLAIWWLGEGFGGLLTGAASPVSGAPGGVVLYAVLAILLWPPRQDRPAPFAAARFPGARAARLAWLVVWASMAALALLPATTATPAAAAMIGKAAVGQPAWLAGVDDHLAAFVRHGGPTAAIMLAVLLAAVAAGIYLPRSASRAALVLAIATAGLLWLAQGLGRLLTGSGTDPGTAPLLALLALAYWPTRLADAPAGPDDRRRFGDHRRFGEGSDTAGRAESFAITADLGGWHSAVVERR